MNRNILTKKLHCPLLYIKLQFMMHVPYNLFLKQFNKKASNHKNYMNY